MAEGAKENWGSGGPYEQYVGRWSRKVAEEFLAWLAERTGIKLAVESNRSDSE
jgi:hypothetical protein